MEAKKADIYFYEERISADKNAVFSNRFGMQFALDGLLLAESHFLWTGNLRLDRAKAKDYGEAIGEQLKKHNTLDYTLHLDRKYHGEPCIHQNESLISFLSHQFKEGIKAKFGR